MGRFTYMLRIESIICFLALFYAFPSCSVAEESNKLEDLTVVSSRLGANIDSLPLSVTVITAEDIKISPAKTIPELLSVEAGVMSRSAFGNFASRSVIDIRGFGAAGTQNTLILLDGKRLNDIDQSTINYTAIPVDNIERIELIRGAGGVLYGDGAVGGVINIVTKSALPGTKKLKAHQSYGSYESKESNASVVYSNELVSMSLFGNFIESEGYRVNNDLDQKNLQGDFRLNFNQTELFTKFGLSEQELGLPGNRTVDPTKNLNELSRDRRGTNNPNDFANEEISFVTFGIKQPVIDGVETIFDIGYRKKEQEAFFQSTPSYSQTNLETLFFTPRLAANFIFFNFNHNVNIGFDFYHYQYGSNIANSISNISRPIHILDVEEDSYALYLNDVINLSDKTSIQVGGRVQHVQLDADDVFDSSAPGSGFNAGAPNLKKSDTEHMFNIGIKRALTYSLSSFINFGQSIRIANVDDINQLSFPAPAFTAVREFTNLSPQRARHIDIGLEYKSKKINASANAYLIKLKNEIHFNSVSFKNENLNPTERKGVELHIGVKPVNKISVSLNYAHTKATFDGGTFAGNTVPLVPQNTANLNINYEVLTGLNLNAGWNYVGEKFFDNDQKNNFGQKVPSYSTIDSKFTFDRAGFDINFSANNILDKKAFDTGVRSTTTAGRYNALPLPERNFFVSIGYTFD